MLEEAEAADPTKEILSKIEIDSKRCWIWQGTLSVYGYGQLRINNRTIKAHRRSWEIFKGKIPEGMCILHKCDVPRCVNPDHLFLGTHSDNAKDANAKGRRWKPGRKLNLEQIEEVRKLRIAGLTHKAIAERFGVVPSTITHILTGRTWSE